MLHENSEVLLSFQAMGLLDVQGQEPVRSELALSAVQRTIQPLRDRCVAREVQIKSLVAKKNEDGGESKEY